MNSIFSQIKTFPTDMQFKEGERFNFTLKAKVEPTNSFYDMFHTELARQQAETTPTAGDGVEYKIQVKKYMTEPGTPQFDFMSKWNNDIPMPFVIMSGIIEKETRGMYYMKLHGKAEKTSICMCCGRRLTHPVSMLYGLGPECGQHAYINPFESEDELNEHLDEVYQKISDVKWEGWVIKSSIKYMEKVSTF